MMWLPDEEFPIKVVDGWPPKPLSIYADLDYAYACQCQVCPCREPATREGRDGPAICDRCEETHG